MQVGSAPGYNDFVAMFFVVHPGNRFTDIFLGRISHPSVSISRVWHHRKDGQIYDEFIVCRSLCWKLLLGHRRGCSGP